MKRLAVLVGGATLSIALAGCGSVPFSFDSGYHEGQVLAAASPTNSLVASAAKAVCRRDWVIEGSVSVSRGPWLRGCIQGFDSVVNSVARP
jgi:hypothetical protein